MITILGNKKCGQTMIDALTNVKEEYQLTGKVCYSGKLDPMAEGVFIATTDTKGCQQLHKMNKVYRYQVVINGPITDSTDLLGLVVDPKSVPSYDIETISNRFETCTGSINQKQNRFSAKCIDGKPIWQWTSEGLYDQIKDCIPTNSVHVYDTQLTNEEVVSGTDLKKGMINKIRNLGPGNQFRQDEIIDQWKSYDFNEEYTILTFESKVSSGTFIRTLVRDMGKHLSVPLMVLQITRVKLVGKIDSDI